MASERGETVGRVQGRVPQVHALTYNRCWPFMLHMHTQTSNNKPTTINIVNRRRFVVG